MKKKIVLILIACAVLAAAVVVWALIHKNRANGIKYNKVAVERGDIEALVVTSGSLNPVTVVDVGSQVSGKISEIFVDFNSYVKKGQLLARLDQSIFLTRVSQNEANYQSSKASLEKARVTLENTQRKRSRALNLFEKSLISFEEKENAEVEYLNAQADLQSAEARLAQAQSQLESSQVDLAYTVIRSPIDGIVISRNINAGQTVAASFQAPVLFQIANDLSQMQVECSVDEADIGKVQEDQKVRFSVDAFPDENFTGRVRQVRFSPEITQNVVTYTTIVDVDNPEKRLRPGMTATVSIIIDEAKNVLRVPVSALRFTPSLPPEEMMKIFQDMQKNREEAQGSRVQTAGSSSEGNPSSRPGQSRRVNPSEPMSFQGGFGQAGTRVKQPSQVWVEEKAGKIKPVLLKTGVTDNTFTEVQWGSLKEGQEVIVGESSGNDSERESGRPPMGRNMMFIRR